MFNKEQLVRILAPLITRDGNIENSRRMLEDQPLETLQDLFEKQPKAAKEAVIQAHQFAGSELQADRQQLQEAQVALRETQEELQWSKFFFQHSHDPEGALADNVANRNALTNTAISLTRDGVITLAALNEALGIVSKTLGLVRTTPKKPATKANLAADVATLQKYCRENRLSFPGESALLMLRDRFGSGFGGADIAQAGQEGIIRLEPESDPAVLAEWTREDELARAKHLRDHASPSELRRAVREQGVKTAAQNAQTESKERESVTAQMQAGYPSLPARWIDGSVIDRRWLIQISNKNYPLFRDIVKRFGSANVTARIQGEQNVS